MAEAPVAVGDPTGGWARGRPGRGARAQTPARARRGTGRRVRLKILTVYVLLLIAAGLLATVAVREVLLIRLEARVQSALDQEVAEFNRFLLIGAGAGEESEITSLAMAFDLYLARNVPSNEEAFAAFVEGRPHRVSLSRFPADGLPLRITELFGSGDTLATPEELLTGSLDTEHGPAYYRAMPVQFGPSSGMFVVVQLPTVEFGEIQELQTYGVAAVLGVLLLACAVAWVLVTRLLGPVELLTETAEQISQSDLNRRIEVRGTGEAADMARTFNAMLDRLESLFRVEREFVRDASHELRVPLTVCLGNLDVMAAGLPSHDLDRAATIALVTDELGRMARIVDDLRLLADAGEPDFLQHEPVQLAALRDDMVLKAQALGLRRWTAEGEPQGTVLADRHRLTEAVMNLADNAVRHTTAEDTIAVGAAAGPGEVRIWVRDTGVGIAPTDQARIFDRFRRGARAYRTYRGSGLGLSIVRAIADAHGGRVDLVSSPGEGATFTIILPRHADRAE
ncbi:MAG TPA: HAMP domain-containing sensor histidine kinase [Pseudonocardiaceae bacterium]